MFLISFYGAQFVVSILLEQADSTAKSFNELNSLFLWSVMGAVGLAAVVVLVWLKIQSKRDTSSNYISIDPSKHGNQG